MPVVTISKSYADDDNMVLSGWELACSFSTIPEREDARYTVQWTINNEVLEDHTSDYEGTQGGSVQFNIDGATLEALRQNYSRIETVGEKERNRKIV